MELTCLSCQICLTRVEQIIKSYLKLFYRNCRYFATSLMATAWFAHRQSCRRVYGTLHSLSHTVQYNMLCVKVVQCNIEDFERGNQYGIWMISCRKRRKGFSIWFPGISLPSKLRMSESWRRSFAARTLICIKLRSMLGTAVAQWLRCCTTNRNRSQLVSVDFSLT